MGHHKRGTPRCGSSSVNVETIACSDGRETDGVGSALAVAQLNPQSAFEIADVTSRGAGASPMMGRASLEASRAVGFDQD